MTPEQYVQEKPADSDGSRLASIPNAQTQAAMRDADAWVVEMRTKETQNIQSSATFDSELL